MPETASAERLRAGDPVGARDLLLKEVTAAPGDARLRVFLFQLSCILGDWKRAESQLATAAQLDESAKAMEETYRRLLAAEAERRRVFAGEARPTIFGKPEPWVADFVEALRLEAEGASEAAERLREAARDKARAQAGDIDGAAFQWIADADSRLGPLLEVIANGGYYWLPFENLRALAVEAPGDLRDFAWIPARLTFANGGESVAFIPSRYPGSEASADADIRLARKTEWRERPGGAYIGAGQRILATDAADYALLDVRQVKFAPGPGA